MADQMAGIIAVRVRQCKGNGLKKHSKTRPHKFNVQDIQIGIRSTNERPNYQCRYSRDLALD